MKKSLRTLTGVVGILCVLLALATFALSFLQVPGNRGRIQKISIVLGPLGAGLLAIHGAFFLLPDVVRRRRSPSWKRRDAIYGSGPFKANDAKVRPKEGTRAILPTRAERSDGGAVLVIVLAVLAAVAAIVLQIQLTARARQQLTETSALHAGLVRAARDAATAALTRLADDEELLYDSREEPWAARENIRTPEGIETITTVSDENRFFDLNNIARRTDRTARPPVEIVRNLLNQTGRFDEGPLIRALQDWTDSDNDGMFEKDLYTGRKPAFTCANRMLLSWNELFDVAGWKPDMFVRRPASSFNGGFNADLVDCVTLVPVKADRTIPVNVNTASRSTLLGVLGLEQDVIVNAILSMRKIQPIATVDAVQQLMEPFLFAQIAPYLSVRSDYFRIESRAFSANSSATIHALAHRSADGHMKMVQWMVN